MSTKILWVFCLFRLWNIQNTTNSKLYAFSLSLSANDQKSLNHVLCGLSLSVSGTTKKSTHSTDGFSVSPASARIKTMLQHVHVFFLPLFVGK
jgi:hypothetical protein